MIPTHRIVTTLCAGWLLGASSLFAESLERSHPKIMVTLPPQTWLVERILGGPEGMVGCLLGPNDSPATFQPSDAQITQLARADLFFRIGVPAERAPWFRAIEAADRPTVVDLRDGIELRKMEHHHHHHDHGHHGHHGHDHHGHAESSEAESDGLDPHVWLSPQRLQIMADTIAQALSRANPSNASSYRSNAAQLKEELDSLEKELRARLDALDDRAFFVFHPAWGYFADDFGLRQVAIETEGKDPSEKELTRLLQLGRELGIRVIFVQPQFRGRAAATVADALGARIVTFDPLVADIPANLRKAAELLLTAPMAPNGATGHPR
ncbi:MAG: zinc ABC transporter substrate-binding protein [Thermoanaerobaculia bacterium]|nr:zinc ABC transporter substrate-binding protein [Thermoanaerobaculia bacterium]